MKNTFLQLLKIALEFKWWMILALFLGFFTISSSIGLVMTASYIIAKAALQPSIAELGVSIVGVRFFGIMRGVFRYFERVISHDVTLRLLTRFRAWFYASIEPLVPSGMIKFRSADLLTRLLTDVQNLENIYLRILAPPLIAIMISVSTFFMYGLFSWSAAFILIAGLFFAGIGIPLLSAKLRKGLGQKIVHLRSELAISTIDGIQGLSDLLVFNQANNHFTAIKEKHIQYINIQRKMALIETMQNVLIILTLNFTILGTLFVLIPEVSSGDLEGVYLSVLVLGIIATFEAVQPLPEAIQKFEQSMASANRLFEVIDTRKEKQISTHSPLQDNFDIRFEGVSFNYNMNKPKVLTNLNLHIPSGRKIAIVGPSGSGKSTILNLMLNFWSLKKGKIFYGGKNIEENDQDQIIEKLAVVQQNVYLFSSTLRENLLLSNPGLDESLLIEMIERTGLRARIDYLPDGLETWVGEMGYRFSGGERQLIALTRALLKNAPVLILDEPTANLDPITEKEVMQTIHLLSVDKTLLLITHRLNGLAEMDEIIVLVEGQIIERGSHANLMTRKGYYYNMVKIQQDIFDS